MKKLVKALFISLIIFVVHAIIFATIDYSKTGDFGYYGLGGGIIYGLMFAFWAYYLFTLLYLYLSNSISSMKGKIVYALLVVIAGYLISRIGDIIDGHFTSKFDFLLLLTFILSAFLLVFLEKLFNRKQSTG